MLNTYATQFYVIAHAQCTHHCLCVCIHVILVYQDGLWFWRNLTYFIVCGDRIFLMYYIAHT